MRITKAIEITTYLGIAVAIILWGYLAYRYSVGDFRFFVVQSGSMSPTLPIGSVVMTTPKNNIFQNSVITYLTKEGAVVTHRVVDIISEGGKISYATKGDANNIKDDTVVPQSRVIGEVVLTMPYIGNLFNAVRSAPGYILLVVIPSMYLLLSGILGIAKAIILPKHETI